MNPHACRVEAPPNPRIPRGYRASQIDAEAQRATANAPEKGPTRHGGGPSGAHTARADCGSNNPSFRRSGGAKREKTVAVANLLTKLDDLEVCACAVRSMHGGAV